MQTNAYRALGDFTKTNMVNRIARNSKKDATRYGIIAAIWSFTGCSMFSTSHPVAGGLGTVTALLHTFSAGGYYKTYTNLEPAYKEIVAKAKHIAEIRKAKAGKITLTA